jgi:hypothetical protein
MAKCEPEPNSGCWLWTAGLNGEGYGAINVAGQIRPAHRVAYELFRGPIPEGLTLDHLCRVRCCVNPDHLEPVTRKENTLRGIGASAVHARKTHCKHGHAFTPDNVYVRRGNTRDCRTCHRARERDARQLGART